VKDQKIIHDAVHGSISVKGVFLDLIESPEFQRLHDIKQLGLAHLVFPGAHHTRLEHSLGTYHISSLMCHALDLEEQESQTIMSAALLHDVGHAPFSHSLEWFLKDRYGFTHDELTKKIILGKESMLSNDDRENIGAPDTISAILERHGIDPKNVARLVTRTESGTDPSQTRLGQQKKGHFNLDKYPAQIIHGPVDCDQMDYLIRDSYYTGVGHGVIDRDRILNTLDVHNGDLVVESRGISAAEGMLVARALMFTTVYFHKTVRIAELMLTKAAENLKKEEMDVARKQNDSGFLAMLESRGDMSRKISASLRYRRLYKAALIWKLAELDDRTIEFLEQFCDYKEKISIEERICKRADVPKGSVILDVPGEEILTTEPRMSSVNIGILENNKVKPLSRVSPLASALQLRKIQDWGLMVACPSQMRLMVKRAAERILSVR